MSFSPQDNFLGGLAKKKRPVRIFKIDWTKWKEIHLGKKHSHARENARRLRQIEKRMLRGAGLDSEGRLIQ